MGKLKSIVRYLFAVFFLALFFAGGMFLYQRFDRIRVLEKTVERLSADSRIAEALVTESVKGPDGAGLKTTIKFLEYDTSGKSLKPHYFTFSGNIIQFQALVIRFDDTLIASGDRLRGRSAYIFLKAFSLSDKGAEVHTITEAYSIPAGYKIPGVNHAYEKKLWEEFWDHALDPSHRKDAGVKNAQIEAPGSRFVPGTIYTLRIEHDGGIRIDAEPLPEILKGETIQK